MHDFLKKRKDARIQYFNNVNEMLNKPWRQSPDTNEILSFGPEVSERSIYS